jgi:hypothetical protein
MHNCLNKLRHKRKETLKLEIKASTKSDPMVKEKAMRLVSEWDLRHPHEKSLTYKPKVS